MVACEVDLATRSVCAWLTRASSEQAFDPRGHACANLPLSTFSDALYGMYALRFVSTRSRFTAAPPSSYTVPTFT